MNHSQNKYNNFNNFKIKMKINNDILTDQQLEQIYLYKNETLDGLNLNFFYNALKSMGDHIDKKPLVLCSYINQFNQDGESIPTPFRIFLKFPNRSLISHNAKEVCLCNQEMVNSMYKFYNILPEVLDTHFNHYNASINVLRKYDKLIQDHEQACNEENNKMN